MTMLPLTAIFHVIFSLWIYGKNHIFPKKLVDETDHVPTYSNRLFHLLFDLKKGLPFTCLLVLCTILAVVNVMIDRRTGIFKKRSKKTPTFEDVKETLKKYNNDSYEPVNNPNYTEFYSKMSPTRFIKPADLDIGDSEDDYGLSPDAFSPPLETRAEQTMRFHYPKKLIPDLLNECEALDSSRALSEIAPS